MSATMQRWAARHDACFGYAIVSCRGWQPFDAYFTLRGVDILHEAWSVPAARRSRAYA